MQKRNYLLSVLLLSAGMLTGCAKETDFSKRFPELMKYSFGEGYSFTYEKTDEQGDDCYALRYFDHSGKEHIVSDTVETRFTPYDPEIKECKDKTEEEYYLGEADYLINEEIGSIFKQELADEILRPMFPDYDELTNPRSESRAASLIVLTMPLFEYAFSEPQDLPLIERRMQVGTAQQVCKADLKSIACDDLRYSAVSMTVKEGHDPAPYLEKFKAAYANFAAMVGSPQTIVFQISQTVSSDKTERLWEKHLILGEEVDPKALTDLYSKEAKARVRKKYGIA
ncbi:MAG: hypothetical protein IK130_06825 [Oscillospiraceae bacterium]|nr:hypothetical protein [Oscillospiraceae bacterium]